MNFPWLNHQIRWEEIRRWLSRRQRVHWHHYVLAALVAYSLPWLAVFAEKALTWRHQMHLAMHYGSPISPDRVAWLWMTLPAAISFLILVPFVRYPIRRRIAVACVCLGWTILLLVTEDL